MEKFYTTPEAEVVLLSADDVIKTSSLGNETIDPEKGFGDAL